MRAVAESLARTQQLQAKGFKATEDVEVTKRQYLDLQNDYAKLQLALDDVNAELIRLINLEDGCCKFKVRIWPAVKLQLPPGARIARHPWRRV